MLLAVRISSYGCTQEVWRALKKLELFSAAPRATLTLLSCSPNFLRASITRYTHAKHEPILNCCHEELAPFPVVGTTSLKAKRAKLQATILLPLKTKKVARGNIVSFAPS